MRSADAVAAMPCPNCRTGLTLSDRSGVEIDYCPTCRGVWLDRGELDKIIDRSTQVDRDRGRRNDDRWDDDDDERGIRGFLSNFFDFD